MSEFYNVAVIGAGTAGLVTAAGTAGLGGRVALIERNKMGGDCLNFGCVPSKALISSARMLHTMRHANAWGIEPPAVKPDFKRLFARMRERRAVIAPHDSQETFEKLGVKVFHGAAQFLSPHEISVDGQKVRAKHFVIATGTRAVVPKIEGIESVRHFTNETIFDELHEKPERLLVLGGGPIGCELAQVFARFDVRVTIMQKGARLLPKEDHDVSAFVRKQLEAEGIAILTDAELKAVKPSGSGLRATIAHGGGTREAEFDALLIASGRQPNIESLDLDAAAVRAGKRGVEVNDYLQTSQPHIYAAGDVTGRYLFTHMAEAQARIVVCNVLMPIQLLRRRADYSVVPWVTYLDPEIARVGLSEAEAREKGIEFDCFEKKMADVDRAVVESADAGFAKVLVKKGGDTILGVTIVAERAGELLQPYVLAMSRGLGLKKVAAAIHPYPTFAEITRKIGNDHARTALTPFVKKLFAALYARQRKNHL